MAYPRTVDGLRWGEVAGLRVGQFDFHTGTVRITQTIVRGKRGRPEIGEPKSAAGWRTLALPVALVEMVGKRMAARGLTADDPDALLFTAPDGGMLRYSNWQRRVWYPATVAAGLGELVMDEATGRTRYLGLGLHDLRRAIATGLVAEGVDIKTAQALLGHSNAQLTLGLYAQAVVSLGAAAAESMAARFQLPASSDGRAMERATRRRRAKMAATQRCDLGGRGGSRTPDICLVRTPRARPPGDMRCTRHQLALSKAPRTAGTLAECWQIAPAGDVANPRLIPGLLMSTCPVTSPGSSGAGIGFDSAGRGVNPCPSVSHRLTQKGSAGHTLRGLSAPDRRFRVRLPPARRALPV